MRPAPTSGPTDVPQIQVTIAGRSYRMACGEGEEQHLEGLAADFDAKVAEMRTAFGEIGDMRLHVMAALTISDDLAETKRRVAALEVETARLSAATAARDALDARLAETILAAAARVEDLASGLSPQAQA